MTSKPHASLARALARQKASLSQGPVRQPTAQAYEEIEYLDNAGRLMATERVPVHSSRVGYDAGLEPEDLPPLAAPRAPVVYDDLPRQRSSALRYTTTHGQALIVSPQRRFVLHTEPPPQQHRLHWLLILGVGMLFMLLLWAGISALGQWWTNHQLDAAYGFPRTYQTDAVVGHADSTEHPSHFLFLNLHGQVLIMELPAGNPAHARTYVGPTLLTENASSVPVTGEFKDVNGDGKIDLIVHIGDQRLIYLNDGTQFRLQQEALLQALAGGSTS